MARTPDVTGATFTPEDGEVADTIVGAVPRSTLVQRIAKHL